MIASHDSAGGDGPVVTTMSQIRMHPRYQKRRRDLAEALDGVGESVIRGWMNDVEDGDEAERLEALLEEFREILGAMKGGEGDGG